LKNLEIQKRNLDLAQKVYQLTEVKYKEGIGTNIEVVNADIELKNAQNNYINALMESYLARVDLQKALGTLYRP
jgi:outer membrane protein TolC